jgi:hypothetical protein
MVVGCNVAKANTGNGYAAEIDKVDINSCGTAGVYPFERIWIEVEVILEEKYTDF